MHKGHVYRRVLPPALTPNYALGHNAPVFLQAEYDVIRDNLIHRANIKMPVRGVTLDRGQIDWATTYVENLDKYAVVISVRLIPDSPDHALQFFVTDDQANYSVMTWRVAPFVGGWNKFGDNYTRPGEEADWTLPWGSLLTLTLKVIGYLDEPSVPLSFLDGGRLLASNAFLESPIMRTAPSSV